ncbi:MAG: hypothetical protein ACI9OE_001644 [Mariniflexile sp.]|jgi:hypothetical protein
MGSIWKTLILLRINFWEYFLNQPLQNNYFSKKHINETD